MRNFGKSGEEFPNCRLGSQFDYVHDLIISCFAFQVVRSSAFSMRELSPSHLLREVHCREVDLSSVNRSERMTGYSSVTTS